MLGTDVVLPMNANPSASAAVTGKKGDEICVGTKEGTIGRAVRKLTPRKSSFVSLLKGKGWGKEVGLENEGVGGESLEGNGEGVRENRVRH